MAVAAEKVYDAPKKVDATAKCIIRLGQQANAGLTNNAASLHTIETRLSIGVALQAVMPHIPLGKVHLLCSLHTGGSPGANTSS